MLVPLVTLPTQLPITHFSIFKQQCFSHRGHQFVELLALFRGRTSV